MPMKLVVTKQQLGTFIRLKCVTNHSNWASGDKPIQVLSEEFHIDDLATVRLQIDLAEVGFIIKIMATNHINAKTCMVKVNVSCQEVDVPFWSQWICNDTWKEIGKKTTPQIKFGGVATNLFDINISVCKVKDEESFQIKLYDDVTFTDFKLCTSDGSLPVHRAYLAAHSEVFQAMLNREWKETIEGCIEIEGVTLQTLRHLKEYMYLGTLPEDGLESLLLLASYYLINSLLTKCVSKLVVISKSGDWSKLLEFAVAHKIPELMCAMQMMVNPVMALEENRKN